MQYIAFLLSFALGHIFGSLIFYFTHRFIFHGKLGNFRLLRWLKAIHTRHHAKPDDLEKALFPRWSILPIALAFLIFGYFFPIFSIGVASFFPVYSYRHAKAHSGSDAYWARHHRFHHWKNAHANYGGIYPILDTILGTNVPIGDFK